MVVEFEEVLVDVDVCNVELGLLDVGNGLFYFIVW